MSFLKTVFKLPKFDDDIRDTNFGLKKKKRISQCISHTSQLFYPPICPFHYLKHLSFTSFIISLNTTNLKTIRPLPHTHEIDLFSEDLGFCLLCCKDLKPPNRLVLFVCLSVCLNMFWCRTKLETAATSISCCIATSSRKV